MNNKVFTITSEPKKSIGYNPNPAINVENWLNNVAIKSIIRCMRNDDSTLEHPFTLTWDVDGEEQCVIIDWKNKLFRDRVGNSSLHTYNDYNMEYDSKMLFELMNKMVSRTIVIKQPGM